MKRIFTPLTCLLIAILTGCAENISVGKRAGAINIADVTAKKLQGPVYGETDEAAAAAARGANEFAFRLSAALIEKSGNGNFVCSPYSVWMPLAALLNATGEEYKESLRAAINSAGISEADINRAASRMLYSLTKQRENELAEEYGEPMIDPLKIANAIFVDKDMTLNKGFAQTFMDYYRGSVMNVDFASEEAVAAVNKWASDNTEGLITDIVGSFEPDTVATLANAIYFSDRWSWEFNPDETTEGVFHSPGGALNAFFMLREGDNQLYYEDENIQATCLQFKTGGGMYIILPRDGNASGLLTSMTNDRFAELHRNMTLMSGKLLLPRFTVESGIMQLSDTLTMLGVPLFDSRAAPLTGGLVEEKIPVWVSSALHKALIEVDEKGTTAAAVTIMMMAGTALPEPTKPFEMICDKPFAFILYGDTYDSGYQVLFVGTSYKV